MSKTLSYLAGAMDSDGYFSIKRSTYHMRVRKDSGNAVYSEKVGLKQVTPQIPDLLKATFGGAVAQSPGQTTNSKPLWAWIATDKIAAAVAESLLPYLLVKRRQAELLIELRKTKGDLFRRLSYWFARENPDWKKGELVTASEAMAILGYKNRMNLSQAVGNGTLLAISVPRGGHVEHKRFPKEFLLNYAAHACTSADFRGRRRPRQLIEWRERIWSEVRELNKVGLHGTPSNHRSGKFAPK